MKLCNLLYTAGVIGVLCVFTASAQANNISAQEFVEKASIANKFEIESSKLALDKSQNGEIRKFAQRMVDDHTKTGDILQQVLVSSNSNLQPEENLDGKHQKLLDDLDAASGKDFNTKYVAIQTKAHNEAVKLFSNYSQYGKNTSLRDFASQTLPTLKKHLKHVKELKAE